MFHYTGVKPYECYEGALYVLYNDYSMIRKGFTGVSTMESGKI